MLVAVYGTLKQGHGNHRVMPCDADLLGEYRTAPEFTMVDLGAFPGVIEGGDTACLCEVYEIDDDQVGRLDNLEGNGSFYTRKTISLFSEGDILHDVWMYMLPSSYLNRNTIESGEWL